jgi:excisionase family DNA binding protein
VKQLIGPHDLAERLGVSYATVMRMASRGDIRSYRIGGKKRPIIRFDLDEVLATLGRSESVDAVAEQ